MLKHEIFLCLMGSTVLHALLLFFLTRTIPVSHLPMIAMETFIIAPTSVAGHGSGQHLQDAAKVPEERRTLKEEQASSDHKRSGLKSATGHEIFPDASRKSITPALEQGPATPRAAEKTTPGNTAAGISSSARFPADSGESSSRAISPAGTEEPREMSLNDTGAPRFIHRELPAYPFMARKLGKEGKVVLRLTLDERGGQKNIEVIERGGFGFTEAAVEAIKKSTLLPAQKDGKAVVSKVLIPVKFVLREE